MATKKEDLNQFFDGIFPRHKCMNCKNDTFQMCYLPTPHTPPDILCVVTKCTSCGDTEQIYSEGASSTPPWENERYPYKNIKGNLNNGN